MTKKNPFHFVILRLIAPNDRNGNGRRCWLVLDVSATYTTPAYCLADDASGHPGYDLAPWILGDPARYMPTANVEAALDANARSAWRCRVQTIETTPGTVSRWLKWQKRRDTEAAEDAKAEAKAKKAADAHAAKLARIESAPIRDVVEVIRDTLLINPAGKAVHRKAGTRFVCSSILESATMASSPEIAFVHFTCKGARWEAPADAVRIERKAAS